MYGTKEDWDRAALEGEKDTGSAQDAWDKKGILTELQIMRLGYARWHLAMAASTFDKMPIGLRPEVESLTLSHLEERIYELQAKAVRKLRGI